MTAFNVGKAVSEYRKAVERLESAPKSEKAKLYTQIEKMRLHWKEWQGEDCLHETAYGEPVE